MIIFHGLMTAMQALLEIYLQINGPLLALALLSLTVFAVMLPLYKLGDKLLTKEEQRKALMQGELDSIGAVPGSNKKYFYTQEIYRRYGYSPLYSLVGLFGLAVQVPFFIAAYQMLHHFEAFSGLTAGPFADLAKPDALLQFSGLSLNLLPIIMTLVNLLAAYYYAESPDEKRKIWLFPALFLLLLYQQPVALVFYWTMNNVFSLLKNVWQACRKSRCATGGHSRTVWQALAIPELGRSALERRWASDPVRAMHFGLLCLALFFGVLYFMYTDNDKEIPSLWISSSLLIFLYLGLYYRYLPGQQLTQQLSSKQGRRKPGGLLFWLWVAVWGSSLLLSLALLWLAWKSAILSTKELQQLLQLRQQVQLLRPITLFLELTAIVVAFALLGPQRKWALLWPENFPLFRWKHRTQTADRVANRAADSSPKLQKLNQSSFKRFVLALACIFVGMFWAVPARVIASDPASFSGNTSVLQLSISLLLFCLLPVLLCILLYFILPLVLRYYSSILATAAAWFFSANVLLFPGKYGAMELTSFKNPLQISSNSIAASALLLALLIIVLFALYLHWQYSALQPDRNSGKSSLLRLNQLGQLDRIPILILLFHVVLIASSLYRVGHYQVLLASSTVPEKNSQDVVNTEAPVHLSKSGKNIVIMMLDKFMGGMVPLILEANPDLALKLDGFTYYPNTVSQAHQTYGGFHPIVGGSEYTMEKMNQNRRSLATDIIEAFTMIPKALQPKGFTSYFVDVKYLIEPRARGAMQHRLADVGVTKLKTSLDYSLLPDPDQVRNKSGAKLKWQNFLAMLGVFQAFGPIFRDTLYDDGRWLNTLGDSSLWAAYAFWRPYIELLNLRQLVQPDPDLVGSYVLLHNHLPHNTTFSGSQDYFANPKNFRFPLPKIPRILQQEDAKNGNQDLATLFLANYESLYLMVEWFDKLKEQGLYDNTLIYLTSDHGSRFFDPSFAIQGVKGAPFKANWHSLYMRKDIVKRGKLQISDELRTMADIPAEFLPQFGITKNPYSGKTLTPVQSEPIPLYKVEGLTKNEERVGNNYQYYIRAQYNLHNRNIFDDSNWEFVK